MHGDNMHWPPNIWLILILYDCALEWQIILREIQSLNDRLKRLINRSRLMLFMKGSADVPKCGTILTRTSHLTSQNQSCLISGFSRQIIQILRDANARFETFDILQDEAVRQGLKSYSDWPTYPQLYLDGELLGGLDVIREEMKSDEFVAKLPKVV